MQKQKFDEQDRNKVISEVEKHLGVKLLRVGSYRKFLHDSAGKSYWVFGGYGDWHGIQADMLKEEQSRSSNGVLIIAKRNNISIEIFAGLLQPLVDNSNELSPTNDGDYQFHVCIRGNVMTIKEVVGLSLRRLGDTLDIDLTIESKSVQSLAETVLREMTPEDLSRLIEQKKKRER